jgi:hypothetical protein
MRNVNSILIDKIEQCIHELNLERRVSSEGLFSMEENFAVLAGLVFSTLFMFLFLLSLLVFSERPSIISSLVACGLIQFLLFAIFVDSDQRSFRDIIKFDFKANKASFYIFIHSILLVGKSARRKEIIAFFNAQTEADNLHRREIHVDRMIKIGVSFKGKEIDVFYKKDIDYFIKLFKREEKSFKVFLTEMFKDYGKNDSIYIWLHLIPRKYSLDTTKELIKMNKISSSSLNSMKELLSKIGEDNCNDGWDNIFNDYSEKDIKRFFSVYFNTVEYATSLYVLRNYKKSIPKMVTMAEFNSFIVRNKEPLLNNIYNLEQIEKLPKLKRIENTELGNLSFKVISDIKELEFWGHKLRHCIKSYFKECAKGHSFLIGVYKDGKPYVNVEVKSLKVIQVRGFQNKRVDEEKLIKDYINSFLKIE